MGSVHYRSSVRTLRSCGSCSDCRHSRHKRTIRKGLLDYCRSNDVRVLDNRPPRMAGNSVAFGMVLVQFGVVLERLPVHVAALVSVPVAVRQSFRIYPNMIVRWWNCYRFRRILRSRIGDNDFPSYRSTNEPRNFDNFQPQLPCDMCLWLMVAKSYAKISFLFFLVSIRYCGAATHLCSVDIEPHNLLTIHSYSYFLHNQYSRRACICYHFVRNTNVLDDHHIYQLPFANYMCLLT